MFINTFEYDVSGRGCGTHARRRNVERFRLNSSGESLTSLPGNPSVRMGHTHTGPQVAPHTQPIAGAYGWVPAVHSQSKRRNLNNNK